MQAAISEMQGRNLAQQAFASRFFWLSPLSAKWLKNSADDTFWEPHEVICPIADDIPSQRPEPSRHTMSSFSGALSTILYNLNDSPSSSAQTAQVSAE